ncbi:energy-coupling factor transport system ATP-binding protein [Pedococcus cremeus]|uniref:Energy-coupling factor transport system ATP-binding protein n=1 Tax=Pedococcus cremeus TaxID=587636 RepID=A0A1H9VW44_9MICO|nr:ATP-binding cassette domain-containing protein [Pedococcus cremeus]SES25905.1 energy-coupling factor transport system ATP-binding protein [Pedococcus cremeus]
MTRTPVPVAATEAEPPVVATGAVGVSGLTWRPYGRRDPILSDLGLALPPGQRVLLVGPSGSGKSTLLRALAGVLEVAESGELAGSVTIDGEAPHTRPGAVGLVLQEPGSGVVAATIGRDVAFGLENTGVPRAAMPARVTAALGAVGLTMPEDTPTHALSGGEQQRLALAGALALEPTLLLLDEPTAMLDPGNAAAVRTCVGEVVAARRLTTVVVEHRLGPWVDFADRMVVLGRDGRVVADGAPEVVLAERGAELVDQGIWVPGFPAPEPASLPPGLFGPGTLGANEVAVDAADVTVARSVRLVSGGTRTTLAVDGQWLQARAGQSLALVGPSGSGKSTLLLALAGLLPVDDGVVRVHPTLARHGERHPAEWDTLDLARTVAWVPQWSSSTIVAGTVLDEVMATSRAVGLVEAEAEGRAHALLDLLGLRHLEQADPRHLSGGEQRRLAMAAAVAHQPALLLADEATVGQDRLTWAAVMGVVEALRDAGSAVVLTTHDEAVEARCDRVVTLERPVQPPAPPTPRRPLVARCGPLSLLAASAAAIPAGVLSPRWTATLVVVAVQVLLGALALVSPGDGPQPRGRLRGVVTRLVPGVIGALSVAWSSWLLGGRDLEVAAGAGLRVLAIVLPSAVLISHIDADALGDHLAQRLRLPARPVVATAAALQRVHTFGDVWTEIARARRVRGLGASRRSPRTVLAELGALTMGMLVRSLQAAATLAVAMDARGFSTAYRRTWWAPAPWRVADSVLVVGSLLPLGVALLARAVL